MSCCATHAFALSLLERRGFGRRLWWVWTSAILPFYEILAFFWAPYFLGVFTPYDILPCFGPVAFEKGNAKRGARKIGGGRRTTLFVPFGVVRVFLFNVAPATLNRKMRFNPKGLFGVQGCLGFRVVWGSGLFGVQFCLGFRGSGLFGVQGDLGFRVFDRSKEREGEGPKKEPKCHKG